MIDLYKLHEHATHAQVHGYLLKWDGSEIRQLVDRLQAAEKDAARYQWLTEQAWFQIAFDRFDPDDHGRIDLFKRECARIIDAAMASQPKG